MDDSATEQFTRLWTQAHPAIAGYVAALAADPHQADDVLQDIALVLLRKFHEYDPGRPFIAWAMGVAKMALLGRRRDQARAATRFSGETIAALADTWQEVLPVADARRQALDECLAGLAGRGRDLVRLRYAEALAPPEIAERLAMSAIAVRVALSRVRTALHDCISRRLAAQGDR